MSRRYVGLLLMVSLCSALVAVAVGTAHARGVFAPPLAYDDLQQFPALPAPDWLSIDGKPGWTSWADPAVSDVAWVITDMDAVPTGDKYIIFWPSPFPGAFGFEDNYATFQGWFPYAIGTLGLKLQYFIQTNGALRVELSGDGATWVDITSRLRLRKTNSGPLLWAAANLSDLIDDANITYQVQIRFRSAAYSAENWHVRVSAVGIVAGQWPLPW